ncbi:WYL domain-containing protein [Citrobacter farmeri]|uniref:WYL domain-containing protein n=1 Tax=Citrobacter farmeri TaxID=67824 RepID=UPI00388D1790|nr:WYL domain-containing protein [Citrobacter farmeri]
MAVTMQELSWSQQQRLHFMERQLLWGRKLTLSMVQEAFDISRNQASRDIRLYRELAPANVPPYNPADQCYRPGKTFTPLFAVTEPHEMLNVISHAVQNALALDAVPLLPRQIKEGVLPAVLTAIEYRAAFEAIYASASTPIGIKRVLVPVAIVYVDNRLHLRAWSEHHNSYRDFVLSRILTTPKFLSRKIEFPADLIWNTWINISLVPNPHLSDDGKRLICKEYQLDESGVYKVRAALVHYFLQTNILPNSPEQLLQAKSNPWSYPVTINNWEELKPYLFSTQENK